MYKAYNLETKKDVILLDPFWAGQLGRLRAMDDRDALVCPGCLQPVRVRAGRTRRWHFAHKHLENCPFEQASPELLATRAVLYSWLLTKFEPEAVTIEKALPESVLPRPVDCWVESEGRCFAYWIITVRLAPDLRERLKQSLVQSDAQANWIFHIGMLRPQKYHPNRLHLTTTEREFLQVSAYDEPHQARCLEPAGTLHYLDPEREFLTTYRGLCRVHAPQLYRGQLHRSRIDELQVSLKTGEFVHSDEAGIIEKHRREQIEQKRAIEHAQATLRQAAAAMQHLNKPDASQPTEADIAIPAVHRPSQPEVGRCVFCGQETSDWWYFDRATGNCKCRACYRAGRA
jgi:hypothetical protein